MSKAVVDPHSILGVKLDASPDDVRKSYLNLVRQFPPDRDADKFREIHTAYQMLSDPLMQAEALLTPHLDRPDLSAIISAAEKVRPRLPKLVLLALGNQQ